MHKAASIGKGPISSSAAEVILPMAGGDVCMELKAVSITRGLVCQFDVVFGIDCTFSLASAEIRLIPP